MPNTRQKKRPFQPSIESYFARADRGTERPSDTPSTPPLPSTVQSSLLSVGLRVRKAVPEGYKTTCDIPGKEDDSFTFSRYRERPVKVSNYSGGNAYNGLMPYCGIFKTGGYAAQQTTSTPAPEIDDLPPLQFDEMDDAGFPMSSQESNSSTVSTESTACIHPNAGLKMNKRPFEDAEEDGFAPGELCEEDEGFPPLSPRSRPVSHTPMPNLNAVRPRAIPRTRRVLPPTNIDALGINGTDSAEDFEEADFLAPTEWIDGEVEMGGV